MAKFKPLGDEVNLAAGIGNSTNVSNASVVRVTNASGGSVVVGLQTSGFVGFSTFTMLQNTQDIVVKRPDDLIHVLGGTVQVVKIAFTQ
jgi:hypothetical protein